MANLLFFFPLLILSSFINAPVCSSPSHFVKHGLFQQKYLEITRPLPLATLTPSCTLPILNHDFGNTIGLPPVSVPYAPPDKCSWNHVALQFNASCQGVQYDRVAAIWLDGVDIFRTSTAEPTESGVFWTVIKDITRYSSLLAKGDISLSVMLENWVDDVYTGVYHVNVTILYYDLEGMIVPFSTSTNREVGLPDDVFVDNPIRNSYEKAADFIIPISSNDGVWFRIENDLELRGKSVTIPKNTYKAVMEICVSFHGDDEFWYSNPPDSYIRSNNLTSHRGHGAYREVLLNIDENLVGSVVPFPVIPPGGINPLYWDPIVSIGAFNHPSYDIELTPFLGVLLDGNSHFMGLKVLDSLPFWLVDANLHIWVDKQCTNDCKVEGGVDYGTPDYEMERSSSFEGLDGSYEVEMRRKSQYRGWVNSSAGNLTTTVSRQVKFKNKIKFDENGNEKKVKQKVKENIEISVVSEMGIKISHTTVKRNYPITITTKTSKPSINDNTVMMHSELENEWSEKKQQSDGYSDSSSIKLENVQKCRGWMSVQDHIVLQGGATTEQSYSYNGAASTYSREVTASNGKLIRDTANYFNFPSFSAM